MLHKQTKQLIFHRRQIQRFPILEYLSLKQQHLDSICLKFRGTPAEVLRSSEKCIHFCLQYSQFERLGDIIIRSQIQPHDDIHLFIRNCQKHDRHFGNLPHLLAKCKTCPVWQRHIQHQQVIFAFTPQSIRFSYSSGNLQLMSLLLKHKRQSCHQTQIIF